MLKKPILFVSLFLLSLFLYDKGYSQPTWTIDPFGKEKKPEKYEEKKLGSERTADKKFTTMRRVIQNNVSHYNFYFNANNKLNAVMERAKMAQKDDFGRLLSFYPYSFENTASQQIELDSVIYKATAGILLHDLRSDWVDNLYLLIGKAYFLRNELDSAALTFQFINYNLFPRKKNEDDSRIVGANENASGNILSIANKEKRNVVQKVISKPPSRNDALIWLTRTLTDKKEYGDAAGLINILHNDPNLPSRLKNDLEEVTAYWFYAQEHYDSSAVHLEQALSAAENKQDKARWEFLLGQMYEMSGNFDKAAGYYAKAAKHTVDPIMDIYARLNDAKMFRQSGNTKELQNSIAKLLKMAKRDKYQAYRDIIYYSTGQLSLQQPDTTNGISFYNKSLHYNENNTAYKSKAFLQLANISYRQRDYKNAFVYYDSLQADIANLDAQPFNIAERRNSLAKVVEKILIIEREDSLQMIAAMAPADRDAFIKKMVKKYRKEQGLKEDDNFTGNTLITFNNNRNTPADLFQSDSKGEWYFYNQALKSRGFNEFNAKWGKRTNVDNWRRKSASDAVVNRNRGGIDVAVNTDSLKSPGVGLPPADLTYEGLSLNVPLTSERLDSSNTAIALNLLELGRLFQFELLDHPQAILTFEDYLRRFPNKPADEAYLGLYYSYNKLGNTAKADYYKNLITTKYAGSKAANILVNPAATQPERNNPQVTKRYEGIYDMFIEGKFNEAMDAKRSADSLYGKNYWTPQLLYIEAVHHIKDKNDSSAITVLKNIISLYPTSPLKEKAQTMIGVLNRRAEIESYLTNLQVTRMEEDRIIVGNEDNKAIAVTKPEVKPAVKPMEVTNKPSILKDSVIRTAPPASAGGFVMESDKPHYVIMVLDKVDGVYIGEARNAFLRYNREKFYNQPITIAKDALNADKALLVFSVFEDADAALLYYDKIKKAAPSEISWLQPAKYSFLIITEKNLQLLKTNKDINTYKTLLNTQFGNKF
jgi:outer membrane protein assembly factor BamD (BamD/ComL family)